MKLVFCGTPQFAVPTLERLAAAGFDIQLVVTQPDRPQGRGMELTAPPVKQSALKLGLPVLQPDKIKKNEEFQAQLRAISPDAIIVVGYGRIIPPWMLTLPSYGNINVHASLLPKYRGAAPIQWAIANGERVTGVTTMHLNEGLDTGDILLQAKMEIAYEDTTVTMAPKLAELGADLLVQTLRGLEEKRIAAQPQDHSQATLAPILNKEDGFVDFRRTSDEIVNRFRGFQPWPGAYTQFRGKGLKLTRIRPSGTVGKIEPGRIHMFEGHLHVLCGQETGTILELLEVKPEGKKAMSAREFMNGYRPVEGEHLG
ncbi:MAG TPA: methionyl-tRNA formyltransferase [Candidatus Angelobacter sp.]|nr:methionyl-tRNA formyltransferase [Candidatus Angelobacter sp.]